MINVKNSNSSVRAWKAIEMMIKIMKKNNGNNEWGLAVDHIWRLIEMCIGPWHDAWHEPVYSCVSYGNHGNAIKMLIWLPVREDSGWIHYLFVWSVWKSFSVIKIALSALCACVWLGQRTRLAASFITNMKIKSQVFSFIPFIHSKWKYLLVSCIQLTDEVFFSLLSCVYAWQRGKFVVVVVVYLVAFISSS